MTFSFSFPAPAGRLSLNDRVHWAIRARKSREWRESAALYGYRALGTRRGPLPPSDVQITFEVGDPTKRRDPHNTAPTVKAIIDGLIDARYWPDDTAQYVTVIDPVFVRKAGKKGPVRVIVEITPREVKAA